MSSSFDEQLSVGEDSFMDTIANLVGGSICIPHTRRAVEYWEALEEA